MRIDVPVAVRVSFAGGWGEDRDKKDINYVSYDAQEKYMVENTKYLNFLSFKNSQRICYYL